MGNNESLPPTEAALIQYIRRAHYQAYIWYQSNVAIQNQPDPCLHGWQMIAGKLVCLPTTLPAAPSAVLELVSCSCKKSKCVGGNCSCKTANLVCTDLCQCNECDNEEPSNVIMEQDDSDQDE